MKFIATIKKVVGKTTLSNDKEFSVLLVTDDPKALEAATMPSDATVRVTIE